MKFPDLPRSGFPIVQTVRDIINYLRSSRIVSINGIKGTSSTNGTTFQIPVGEKNKLSRDSQPPFFVNIYKTGTDWKAFMVAGEVIARSNKTGSALTNFTPTSIPTKATPITITAATKIWCKVSESASGIATAAEIGYGTSWLSSLAPLPPGGDNASGTAGYRYYKIAQFSEVGDELEKEQLLTGHIDHYQLTLAENTTTSPSTGEARVLKVWNSAEGRWDFRYIESNYGILATEDTNKITVDFNAENLGGYDGCKVLDLPSDPLPQGKAKFRQIRQLNSTEEGDEEITAQINVSIEDGQNSAPGAGDTIRVRGNGVNGSIRIYNAIGGDELLILDWQDGLITTYGDTIFNVLTEVP